MSGNYLTNHATTWQSESHSVALSNKFECLQNTESHAEMNKQKETEYVNRIQTLEAALAKSNRAKTQWQDREKKLEEEKLALTQKYEELKKVSDQRNAELQSQIDAINARFSQTRDDDDLQRKKFKRKAYNLDSLNSNPSLVAKTSESNEVTNMEEDASGPSEAQVKPPPIFVHGVSNYPEFSKFLKANKVADCIRKETNSGLILTTKMADQFRQLHSVLRKECADLSGKEIFGAIQIHSYQLKSERAFVIYIRGLPSTMDTKDIWDALVELQFTPRRITNVPRRSGDTFIPRPLFRVELEPDPKNPEIYNVSSLNQVRITVESFKPRKDPPQCRNCQRFGHTKHYCLRTPRCIKCGNDHASEKCTLERSAPCKCANCGDPHPASYRGCSVFQKLRKSEHKATEVITKQKNTQLPDSSAPAMAAIRTTNPLKTFASVSRSSPLPPPINTPPAVMEMLLHLSDQVTQLMSRLTSLEKTVTDADWKTVSSHRSRRRHE